MCPGGDRRGVQRTSNLFGTVIRARSKEWRGERAGCFDPYSFLLVSLSRTAPASRRRFRRGVPLSVESVVHPRSTLAVRAARTGYNNDQGGRRLWIQSDATYLQPAPRRRPWPQAPRLFAQQTAQGGAAMSFYEKGPVRIHYEEAGSGFPLLLIAGGGLNSTISGLTNPFNAIEEFKGEYRCIASDLRTATGGQSSGPLEIDRPWDSFSDDQLGLMDHLGVRKFMV